MEFFNSAVTTLQTIVVGLGGALCVWGGINLLEGYGQDNPASKSQGVKQLVAGGGVALIGVTLAKSACINGSPPLSVIPPLDLQLDAWFSVAATTSSTVISFPNMVRAWAQQPPTQTSHIRHLSLSTAIFPSFRAFTASWLQRSIQLPHASQPMHLFGL